MENSLLELQTSKLLEKFGAGNHKPGSGSAVALQGLLSAQLIRTVVDLTKDDKHRHNYEEILPELLKINKTIESNVYPDLERLLHADSAQFDAVIKSRQIRENEKDPILKAAFANQALEELKKATEIPIEIANLCIQLTEFAVFVFDHGFKSARGDSGVSINIAVSCIPGCLSIIDLNLLSFKSDMWTDKISSDANRLRTRYKELYSEATIRQRKLKEEFDLKKSFYLEIDKLLSSIPNESELTNTIIENVATELQRTLWIHKSLLRKNEVSRNPIDVLKPEIVFKKMKYSFEQKEDLGKHLVQGDLNEIAGQIDKRSKIVLISKKFSTETQNFTAAHELGHALFHKQNILHRDKALDGNSFYGTRDIKETQADKFAAYFLMPGKHVVTVFRTLFLTDKFIINENTVFAINKPNLREECMNIRELSRLLASVEFYNYKKFKSIAEQFGVSQETMAIRLEELELLEL